MESREERRHKHLRGFRGEDGAADGDLGGDGVAGRSHDLLELGHCFGELHTLEIDMMRNRHDEK